MVITSCFSHWYWTNLLTLKNYIHTYYCLEISFKWKIAETYCLGDLWNLFGEYSNSEKMVLPCTFCEPGELAIPNGTVEEEQGTKGTTSILNIGLNLKLFLLNEKIWNTDKFLRIPPKWISNTHISDITTKWFFLLYARVQEAKTLLLRLFLPLVLHFLFIVNVIILFSALPSLFQEYRDHAYPKCLELYLTHSKFSINEMNQWMN